MKITSVFAMQVSVWEKYQDPLKDFGRLQAQYWEQASLAVGR